jgi:hypothetical protein
MLSWFVRVRLWGGVRRGLDEEVGGAERSGAGELCWEGSREVIWEVIWRERRVIWWRKWKETF